MRNVFLIGAMKCGTNTLYKALAKHAHVATPKKKELDYFLEPHNRKPYADLFEIGPDTRVCLDGTTQYSKYPGFKHIPQTLFDFNPDSRIIYMMRDPVERLESNVAHAIARKENITVDDWRGSGKLGNMLSYSRYFTQIAPYIQLFGQSRVFLGIFEEFINDQPAFIERVCDFLDLDKGRLEIEEVHANPRRKDAGADSLSFSRDDDRRFARELKVDIDCLERHLGIDASRWWKRYQEALSHE
ncbi:sulfotransferase family protein [Natronospira bacteriovora]|uniref:Sulfotransferase n=1 Tax=Natronospira bacteriovora TaxID=3069753 RepID=A0ABU0W7X4_9GAMM|nr:sulfotransferase [Natronospira sp. AB-CW4]MDQ2070132.1 sulfotransferase [Natronospira sp. AB-CW4]